MYQTFREHNALAGQDAWYCAYSHPDSGLRGSLSATRPISSAGVVVDPEGFKLLLTHCLEKLDEGDVEGLLVRDETKVLVSHLHSFSEREFKLLADVVLDDYNFSCMSFMSQPVLTSLGCEVSSLLVLDIGAYSTRAIPVYESFCLSQCVEMNQVGGEHLTDYMEQLLHGQKQDRYSSLLLRRRQQFARTLKEKHCFIASSFDECVEMYGKFQFLYEKVMHTGDNSNSADAFKCDEGSKTDNTSDIEVTETFTCADGGDITVTVDRELFHCPELLFSPFLLEQCAGEASIVDIILASVSALDESIRTEVARTILITGSSSQLEGLTNRLQNDLSVPMAAVGVADFLVVAASSSCVGAQKEEENTQHQHQQQQVVNSVVWRGCGKVVSAALKETRREETPLLLPNLVTAAAFEKCGEDAFSFINT
jgi:actin-related protein